jgi:hypothetical protein
MIIYGTASVKVNGRGQVLEGKVILDSTLTKFAGRLITPPVGELAVPKGINLGPQFRSMARSRGAGSYQARVQVQNMRLSKQSSEATRLQFLSLILSTTGESK